MYLPDISLELTLEQQASMHGILSQVAGMLDIDPFTAPTNNSEAVFHGIYHLLKDVLTQLKIKEGFTKHLIKHIVDAEATVDPYRLDAEELALLIDLLEDVFASGFDGAPYTSAYAKLMAKTGNPLVTVEYEPFEDDPF